MHDYTKYKRGSEWRKWDLHIHTPETKKNDQFEGNTIEAKWDKYISDINNSTEEISVIGITDYFCIDNYFKFKSYVDEKKITKHFDLVIPNIEIRVLPVTGSATPINIHCIFNPAIDSEIETRFLSKLKFNYSGSDYSAQKNELIRLGKALPGNASLNNDTALKAGIGQYVISMPSLREIFEKDIKLRDNTIIVVSNKSTDGASGIRKHADFFTSEQESQLDATRWSIYQFADSLFSSNPGDILYFIGQGTDNKETVIQKCATLMPCFHGCDAHSNDKIFKPAEGRFCWIKADPTFEGLKQTLYEPEDRIRIQTLKPDVKNDRFLISELNFIDSGNLFGNQSIPLNDNLNAIIGGKSSGKSLLLYSTAKSIDPEQVDRASKRLNFEGYKFSSPYNFEVLWKNNEKDSLNITEEKNHKIIYIPQLYINYLVERNNKEDLNSLIENILLQDLEYKQFYQQQKELINVATIDIEKLLSSFLQLRIKALDFQKKSKDLGKSDAITKSIENIQATIKEGQKTSNLSEEEFDIYNKLMEGKSLLEKQIKEINDKEIALNKIVSELNNSKASLLGQINETNLVPLKGKIDLILGELTIIPNDLLLIKAKIETDFNTLLANLSVEISKLNIQTIRNNLNSGILEKNEKLKPYVAKIAGQQELQKLTIQLEKENQKMQEALNLEKQFKSTLEEYKNTRTRTVSLLKHRYEIYKGIETRINSTKKDIGSEITLNCSLIFKQENFALFEQANKGTLAGENSFQKLFTNSSVNYENVLSMYDSELWVSESKLYINKIEAYIPVKIKTTLDEVLRGLINDGFDLDYSVTYKGDDLLSMSPGKKGTVLLILFLQISSSEYPILIDQPEDNLDNRTIYELLCKMIKKKKRERQIIIVSHNANLVVATDTENIIVANQEGQDSLVEAGRYRFEYVNGSLEHSFPKDEKITKVLHQQGIKEHVCDILEGGDEAFKQREKKYSIK